MIGGYAYRRSQFNRATQALRQTGSVIKPFLYTAAVENGFTPATIIQDEPVTFTDKWTGEPWTPRNYDRDLQGLGDPPQGARGIAEHRHRAASWTTSRPRSASITAAGSA